ncbi:MAG: hypothetical protein Hyperionvirus23_10 [Hyperionvirus sp.]|uniref:Uncharacterized protein n=1 Tax=Hyperionvirus sp. TaxID=2487770 RepID=A0A3G5AEN4_9VIRU|nr:MAG: hypothetical protein Hyperionvirus23_10 [Hyperionvirus sp.]
MSSKMYFVPEYNRVSNVMQYNFALLRSVSVSLNLRFASDLEIITSGSNSQSLQGLRDVPFLQYMHGMV